MIEVRPATLRDATYLAVNMRPQDVEEMEALVDATDRIGLACVLLGSSQYAFVGHLDGQPAGIVGLARLFPHVLSGWAYGTPAMRRVVPALTRRLQALGPELIADGYVRIEVRTMASHDLSHRWLTGMGAILETPKPFVYGRRGELFVQYGFGRENQ